MATDLSDLNMTEAEMGRFTQAFKDENFRKMLRDYAEEISDPENRKKYEEEISILEQERGNSVQFIHPTPFKCVRTSADGKLKCYVNVCANDKIGKPSCKTGVSEDGHRGHQWALPHSLHPERKELDPKGNKILIYDVIFHPDTLHMASKNKRFMDLVMSVAMESIQDAFHVRLDKNNTRTMGTKYKGTPQACVIRKPLPGFQAKDTSDDPDPLAFPYPDNKPAVSKKEGLKDSPSQSIVVQETQEPTKPHHIIKHRSFIDLQDFRCSRDSAQSPRPKEIVITVDLPLLKSVAAVTLEVKEKSLLLESQNPAYKLELTLAYPVDEDRGEAKFNTQARQLVVTLPVRPSKEGFQIYCGPAGEPGDDIQEDVFEERQENSQESMCEIIEREEQEGVVSEMKEDSEDGGQHQEGNDQRLCEGQQDGPKTEEQGRVSCEQIEEVTMQRNQVCDVKEEEEELEAIQEETEVKTEKDQVPACTEDPVRSTELVTAEEMTKEHTRAEKSVEEASADAVVLREVNEDGSETLIKDHVTSAGFSFHNSLLFELD